LSFVEPLTRNLNLKILRAGEPQGRRQVNRMNFIGLLRWRPQNDE
jgi:hypothetical protein